MRILACSLSRPSSPVLRIEPANSVLMNVRLPSPLWPVHEDGATEGGRPVRRPGVQLAGSRARARASSGSPRDAPTMRRLKRSPRFATLRCFWFGRLAMPIVICRAGWRTRPPTSARRLRIRARRRAPRVAERADHAPWRFRGGASVASRVRVQLQTAQRQRVTGAGGGVAVVRACVRACVRARVCAAPDAADLHDAPVARTRPPRSLRELPCSHLASPHPSRTRMRLEAQVEAPTRT